MASRGRERSGVTPADIPVAVIRVAGQEVVIDQRTMTMRERQAMRAALATVAEHDDLDALCAAIWVVMRRDDPTLTFDDVCESITIADLADATQLEPGDRDEADPS
jgi:hypothetical protein